MVHARWLGAAPVVVRNAHYSDNKQNGRDRDRPHPATLHCPRTSNPR
jgi:hypothetical protein